MSAETMIAELQSSWDRNDYEEEAFIEYARFFILENDTSRYGCVFDEAGFAYPIDDFVISRLVLNKKGE